MLELGFKGALFLSMALMAVLGFLGYLAYISERAPRAEVPTQSRVISWTEARQYIKECEVEMVMQAHSLDVTLRLKNGVILYTKEPVIDQVLEEVDKARSVCGNVAVATE